MFTYVLPMEKENPIIVYIKGDYGYILYLWLIQLDQVRLKYHG